MKDSEGDSLRERKKMTVKQLKVYLTASIILIGVILSGIVSLNSGESSLAHADGILIDFEEYDTTWFEYDLNTSSHPISLLEKSCEKNGYTLTINDNVVTEINGVTNDDTHSWGLWYVVKNSTTWTKSNTYEIDMRDYSIVTWAYRASDETPTVAVDATGVSIYGYSQAMRVVTLSPVATETVGAMNAVAAIVGADYYSNYPNSIIKMKNEGKISIVGTYTDPSYEIIMKQNPDLVVADSTQYNQVQVAKAVRDAGVTSIVLYEGEDMETIYNNTFIVGMAMGYGMTAQVAISEDELAVKEVASKIDVSQKKRVMVALSPDSAPYVAGNYTYVNDIINTISAENAFASMNGWAHANTEMIAQKDADVIIIVTDSYEATQSEWDYMYSHLPETWKMTKAYANKEIYLVTGKASDLASRAAPRFPQLCELLAEIIYPDSFDVDLPKYVGDDYKDYLTITKYLSYDN